MQFIKFRWVLKGRLNNQAACRPAFAVGVMGQLDCSDGLCLRFGCLGYFTLRR
ncbi:MULTISPECIES: hypothetical protein [Neisseria]|uniref:hypothetical protein n=1 Tax=Neisseria TaxID=482 RepID=UPI0012E0C7EC|nr:MULTISPECIES: hypothetical protein [Neisseria]